MQSRIGGQHDDYRNIPDGNGDHFHRPLPDLALGRDYWAPLVVVQIITGILLGPGMLGAAFPGYYQFVFNPAVIQLLNGIAWWS